MKLAPWVLMFAAASASAQEFDWRIVLESGAAEGAGFFSAEKLYRFGKDSFVIGYVSGVYDADRTAKPLGPPYCVPDGVTNGQLVDVAWKYLEANPERRHLSAAHLVRMSFRAAYPCPSR